MWRLTVSNNALQTIINAQLPGNEGLWQIHLHDGKISAIDAQSGVTVSYTHLGRAGPAY